MGNRKEAEAEQLKSLPPLGAVGEKAAAVKDCDVTKGLPTGAAARSPQSVRNRRHGSGAADLGVSNNMACCTSMTGAGTLTGLGTLTLIMGILAITLNQKLYDAILDQKLELTPTSEGYDFWHTMPVPIYIRFFFWNVTNHEEVLNANARPVLRELGPYTYSEKHLKVNMSWNDNDTVTYMQIKTWHFEPSMSVGSLDDEVTTLNVPLLAAAAMIRDLDYFMKVMFNEIVNTADAKPFTTHTVREFLFDGYSDPLLDAASIAKLLINITIPFDKFGWFYARNGTNYYDGVFNMDTGRDVELLGNLHYWNNTNVTDAFDYPCNMINGSAGELFHPGLQKDYIEFYSTDICRSLRVPYREPMSIYGLDGYRYEADEMMFAAPEKNPDNWCYCNGECPPAGLLNETLCRFGVPAFVSFPHMLYADPSVIDQTVGQRPNRTIHNFNIALEPVTGVPLSVQARFQINMLLKPNTDVVELANVPTFYLPMLWFENTVETTPEIASQFVTIVDTVPVVMRAGSYALAVAGLAVLLAGCLLLWRAARLRTADPVGEEPLTSSATEASLDSVRYTNPGHDTPAAR